MPVSHMFLTFLIASESLIPYHLPLDHWCKTTTNESCSFPLTYCQHASLSIQLSTCGCGPAVHNACFISCLASCLSPASHLLPPTLPLILSVLLLIASLLNSLRLLSTHTLCIPHIDDIILITTSLGQLFTLTPASLAARSYRKPSKMADQILSDGDQDMPFNKRSMRRNLVPTAKLVDANNVAQPGLTSQQKVIDNF